MKQIHVYMLIVDEAAIYKRVLKIVNCHRALI